MVSPLGYRLACYTNARVIRDAYRREQFKKYETTRQALRYIARNMALSPRQRTEAQLRLTQLPVQSQPTKMKGRCTIYGKGRGILRCFKISRYAFRMAALAGDLPGVKPASW